MALQWQQKGAVLLVSMVMLLVLTLLGVAAVDSSGMQLKMANNHKDRLIAMQAAEAGLRAAESYIENVGFSDADLSDFDSSCTDGLCFVGTGDPTSVTGCLRSSLIQPVLGMDETLAVFDDGTADRSVEVDVGAMDARVKYIIEFKCYSRGSPSDINLTDNPYQKYEITAYAETGNGRGRVMLQSEYRVPD